MLGLSVRQLLKGHLLGPLLTLTLYGLDFANGFRKQTATFKDAD
jgi:hypothetical protein